MLSCATFLRRRSVAAKEQKGAKLIPLSLVALGGYGRGELNPFSDVDVMFLHRPGKGCRKSLAAYRRTGPLSALGYRIQSRPFHAFDSRSDRLANGDMLTKTAMLEARHLAGDTDLFQRFRTQFRQACVHGHETEYVDRRMQDQALRHAEIWNTVYRAGAEREERLRRAARLSKSSLDDLFQGRRPHHHASRGQRLAQRNRSRADRSGL